MIQAVAHDTRVRVHGGGITGLATAYFLLEAGHDPGAIEVLERRAYWGGHARTLYLYRDGDGDVRLLRDYRLDVSDPLRPRVRPSAPSAAFLGRFPSGEATVDDPSVLPADVGYTVFTPRYANLLRLHARLGGLSIDVSPDARLLRRYELGGGLVLRSHEPLLGLWRTPGTLLRRLPDLLTLRRDLEAFSAPGRGPDPDGDTLAGRMSALGLRGSLFERLATAMVALYGGFGAEHLDRLSARYAIDFLHTANMARRFAGARAHAHGASVPIALLAHRLAERGVRLRLEATHGTADAAARAGPELDGEKGDEAVRRPSLGSAAVFAGHPWQHPGAGGPEIPFVTVPVYLHATQRGLGGADVVYRHDGRNGHTSYDLDRYRPDRADFGVGITFGLAGGEADLERRVLGGPGGVGPERIVALADYDDEPLRTHAVRLRWTHALVTPEAIAARSRLPSLQGRERLWWASASLVRSARHEDGVTSALDAVASMKGAEAMRALTAAGWTPSPRPAGPAGEG